MKGNKWLFLAIAALIIVAVFFNTGASKKLRDLFKKDLQEKEFIYKKKYDSLQNVRKKETAEYLDQLDYVNSELEIINNKFELQRQKTKHYEKELATYRNGDYDGRFNVFSETYNPKDNDQR